MRESYCNVHGKVAHDSENAARIALKSLKKAKGYNGHIYMSKPAAWPICLALIFLVTLEIRWKRWQDQLSFLRRVS